MMCYVRWSRGFKRRRGAPASGGLPFFGCEDNLFNLLDRERFYINALTLYGEEQDFLLTRSACIMYEVVKYLRYTPGGYFCPLAAFVYTNGDKGRCSLIFWLNQVDIHVMYVFQLMFQGFEMLPGI